MKKYLFLLFALVFFTSCEDAKVREGRELYKAYFNYTLKDPSSLEIFNEEYTIDGEDVRWKLDYGARNSFGGMVRKTIRIRTYHKDYLFTKDEFYTDTQLGLK